MKLSQSAALLTVFVVGLIAAMTVVLLMDSLPEGNGTPAVEFRPATYAVETASLPRGPVDLEPAAPAPAVSTSAAQIASLNSDARLAFVPPGALPAPSGAPGLRASLLPSEDDPLQSWTTKTQPAKQQPRVENKAVVAELATKDAGPLKVPDATPMTRSLQERLAAISPGAMPRLVEKFKAAKVSWPPAEVSLVAIKDEKALEMYARQPGGPWTFIHRYKVLAASGRAGPKLTRGDKQVPEGIYGISYLNPNSRYHVSMRVSYPNTFDRRMAAKDKRRDLGNDIMIHGKKSSAGCLAMGDEAAEELFLIGAQVGVKNVKVVIAPTDFRRKSIPAAQPGQPEWVPKLYLEVASAMSEFKAPPPETGSLLSLLGL